MLYTIVNQTNILELFTVYRVITIHNTFKPLIKS